MPTASAGFHDTPGLSGRDTLSILGPTVQAQIGFDASFRDGQSAPPNLGQALHLALIDTGASYSSIDSSLAEELGLPRAGTTLAAGVSGPLVAITYQAQVFIPSLNAIVHGELAAAHLRAGGQPHAAILGRDFLRNFTMTYEGRTGQVTLSND